MCTLKNRERFDSPCKSRFQHPSTGQQPRLLRIALPDIDNSDITFRRRRQSKPRISLPAPAPAPVLPLRFPCGTCVRQGQRNAPVERALHAAEVLVQHTEGDDGEAREDEAGRCADVPAPEDDAGVDDVGVPGYSLERILA